MKKKKAKKNTFVKLLEYYAAYSVILITGAMPRVVIRGLSNMLGDILFFCIRKRHTLAVENVRKAFPEITDDGRVKEIARSSCRSSVLTFLEIIQLRSLYTGANTMEVLRGKTKNIDALFQKAKKVHDESGGCIFVTPHIGNWEILPYASSFVGIPLAIVARPLDNEYLEKLVYSSRTSDGQVLVPKKNALFTLQKTLQKGISIGMLPDQSTRKGLAIDFFGRSATTTPVPAMLSVTYNRPVIVVACCRKNADQYEGFVCDPIYPGEYTSEKAEIIRITEEITKNMETIIRKYPEQYLWMHNRWKTYKDAKAIMSS